MKRNYLCIEAPDTEATVDFMGKHGVVVTLRLEKNRHGEPQIYIMAKACDDQGTILGEILATIPESDDRE